MHNPLIIIFKYRDNNWFTFCTPLFRLVALIDRSAEEVLTSFLHPQSLLPFLFRFPSPLSRDRRPSPLSFSLTVAHFYHLLVGEWLLRTRVGRNNLGFRGSNRSSSFGCLLFGLLNGPNVSIILQQNSSALAAATVSFRLPLSTSILSILEKELKHFRLCILFRRAGVFLGTHRTLLQKDGMLLAESFQLSRTLLGACRRFLANSCRS